MSVTGVDASTVLHSSGAEIGGIDRTTIYYQRDGRRLRLAVDRGAVYAITLAPVLLWDDGAPVEERELVEIKEAVEEACGYWGVTADICRVDSTAPGMGIDQIVNQIQQSRPVARPD